jgi:CcmD family protein
MNNMIYLVAGYAVFWLVSFGLIFSMASRQQKLEQEMTMLEQLAQQKTEQE